MYKVKFDTYSSRIFLFRNWDDAMNFAGMAVEAGTEDGKPISVTLSYEEERGLEDE